MSSAHPAGRAPAPPARRLGAPVPATPQHPGTPRCAVRRSFQPRRRNPSRGPRAARRLLDILFGILRGIQVQAGEGAGRPWRDAPSMHLGGTAWPALPGGTAWPALPGGTAWPALPGGTAQQTARRRPRAVIPGESPALGPGAGRRPAHTAPARRTHNATRPRTRISPVVHPPRRKRRARARIRDTQLRVRTVCFQIPEALPGCCPVRSNRKYHLV